MIRRVLDRIADYFMDADWLRERRKEEVEAIRETKSIVSHMKGTHWYEAELLHRIGSTQEEQE